MDEGHDVLAELEREATINEDMDDGDEED